MQRPLIPRPIIQQIRPEHSIPDHRPKRDPVLPGLVAVDKRAPPLVARRRDHRKVRPAARDVLGSDVGEERTLPVAARGGRRVLHRVGEPVRVEVVVLAPAVLDELQRLEVRPGRVEALE